MTEIDIDMPDRNDVRGAIAQIERVMRENGLTMASRGTLKTYPGCTHWHYKRGDEKGTLEITLLAGGKRVWFTIQTARRAPWIDQVLPRLKAALEKRESPES